MCVRRGGERECVDQHVFGLDNRRQYLREGRERGGERGGGVCV